jgi:hypothetical protein
MNEVTTAARPAPSTVLDVIARGDLGKLTDAQKVEYYGRVCDSLGLNAFTKPFEFITLQGKLVLYARKDACDQLRKLHGISTEVRSFEVSDTGLLTVRVRATDKHGRTDEDFGVVSVASLKGEAAANAFKKAITQAKRRVTLSICGLGMLDESEVEDRAPSFGPQPLRLDPSMSQKERTDIVSKQAGPEEGSAALRPQMTDVTSASEERVPDRVAGTSDAERAATEPFVIPRPDDSDESWATWWQTLMAYVKAAPDVETINTWTMKNAESMGALQRLDTTKHRTLVDQITRQMASRSDGGT